MTTSAKLIGSPLMYSSTPEVVTLLIEAGADVNIETDDGKTVL
jgi:hypothetical protein